MRLGDCADFAVGPLRVSPSRRRIESDRLARVIEPRVMQVLVALADAPGRLVSRQSLFECCWNGTFVGEDSLNRVIAGLRKVAQEFAEAGFTIETIRSAGYVLYPAATANGTGADISPDSADDAIEAGWHSWRSDIPQVDERALALLERAVGLDPENGEAWAMLALSERHAAEYAEPEHRARHVAACQKAAARAKQLDGDSPVADAALIGLPPIYGDWIDRRRRLKALLARTPDCWPALHDLAILEMATGRPSAAVLLIEQLLDRFPLAPALLYKRVYHLWTLGRIEEMDRVADRAVQLWPGHMAIAMARLWSLAFTGRPEHALRHLYDVAQVANIPAPAMAVLATMLAAVPLDDSENEQRRAAIDTIVASACNGPVQANAAIIQLGGLGAVEKAFAVADGYFLRQGQVVVGMQTSRIEPAITDQSRRVTQLLFIPATASMRCDPRFGRLTDAIGLDDYWRHYRLEPDHHRRADRVAAAMNRP
jgi:DNA-binding winged helix-turn-helix (wHTH) protein